MKCAACKSGTMKEGSTTFTVERGQMILVIKHVPGLVCSQCGEEYVTGAVHAELERIADQAERERVTVVIRDYGERAPVA